MFVVFQPEVPSVSAVKDVFCRFGDFVDFQLIPGKNFGYAYYVSEESANRAIKVTKKTHDHFYFGISFQVFSELVKKKSISSKVLHGEELLGNRMKVMEAEPRQENKRPRRD